MKRTFKKVAAAVMAVTTLAVGSVGMTASAAYGSFSSTTWTAQTTNTTGTSRKVIASVTVYRNSTGAYVTTSGDSKTGGNRTSAYASVSSSTYPKSSYNFSQYGAVYNSTADQSGVAQSWSTNK